MREIYLEHSSPVGEQIKSPADAADVLEPLLFSSYCLPFSAMFLTGLAFNETIAFVNVNLVK